MNITKFTIANFKGIADTTLHLNDETPGSVITLIGLNESGKTTILEAISHFVTKDEDAAGLVGTVSEEPNLQDIIPKERKAAFTGTASVTGHVVLEVEDVNSLGEHLRAKHNLILDTDTMERRIEVSRAYKFEDSTLKSQNKFWTMRFNARPKRKGSKLTLYTGFGHEVVEKRSIWLSAVEFLSKRMPKIVYFPTFLFNFPDKIYLDEVSSPQNSYYVQVIQDVLDSQGEGLDIKKHILDRIKKVRDESSNTAAFLAAFYQRDERRQMDAVFQAASNEMSRVIFGSWNQILGRSVTGKRVHIDWFLGGENGTPYLEVSIIDGQSKYSLSERSLGFRWFFSFLLFTEFRRNRKAGGSNIFLFDEPAANLHSKAQIKLLESFSRIATSDTHIIYSTHSHYMINPIWLEKAYIIENRATNYDNEDEVDSFASRKTQVEAVRYRTFVGKHPNQTTYFQPVLDALDIPISPLVSASKALIVEGKNDYYPLVYFRRKFSASQIPQIFPGNGASGVGTLISLFRGWGVDFRILLDGDKAGVDGKKRYLKDFYLATHEVVTLSDLSPLLAGMAFEAVYQEDVRQAARDKYKTEDLSKRDLALFMQELVATKNSITFADTEAAFKPISDWIDAEFLDSST